MFNSLCKTIERACARRPYDGLSFTHHGYPYKGYTVGVR